jgi:hypothetical protein
MPQQQNSNEEDEHTKSANNKHLSKIEMMAQSFILFLAG